MTPESHRQRPHRTVRPTLATAVVATLSAALLSACSSGSSASDSAGASSATSPAAAASTAVAAGKTAASSAVPTQDVVSAIRADPKLTAELPAEVRARGTLLLGTTLQPGAQGLPHAGTVAGSSTYVGVDIDLREAVAKVLGVTWKVQNGTFPTIIPGVQNGRYDVGQDNFGVTAEREKVIDFATYLTDGQSFLGGASSKLTTVSTLTDICGLTVGTAPGSTFQQILTTSASTCAAAGKKPYTVQYYAENAPIWLGLANGKLDLFFGPTLSLKYDAEHVPGTRYLGEVSTTKVGFVTGKGSPVAPAVRDAVNALIASGDYKKILDKWGVASSGVSTSELNPKPSL